MAGSIEIDTLNDKIRELFPGECVNKGLSKSGILSSRALPSFVSDWLISKYAEADELDSVSLQRFLSQYLPDKSKADQIKHQLISERKTVKILAKFSVEPDIKTGEEWLEIPILDIKGKEGCVSPAIASESLELLNGGMWGIGELIWKEGPKKGNGKIELISFKPFKPYSADLGYYREARKHFNDVSEWIDFLIKSMEYDPKSFDNAAQKLKMISRLLPFVEPRVNLIELAPKGTGKSYVFGRLSKYGWLISGGSVSRAQLFYDIGKKRRGIITRFDYIALDEIQTIKFSNPEEVVGALKGYLESGEYKIGAYHGEADASFVLLGNISISRKEPRNAIYTKSLPKFMQESAFLDRFHGLIEGWKLPRIKEGSVVKGYAINSEFFSEVLHELRYDMIPNSIVTSIISVPKDSDKRDVTAIKRIATGYFKLIFPDIRSVDEVDIELFRTYCLNPAIEMRRIIRKQLSLIDEEYSDEMPEIRLLIN
jgi:ATP-dependent Lon protease